MGAARRNRRPHAGPTPTPQLPESCRWPRMTRRPAQPGHVGRVGGTSHLVEAKGQPFRHGPDSDVATTCDRQAQHCRASRNCSGGLRRWTGSLGTPPKHVVQDARDVVVALVDRQRPAEGDRAHGKHRTAAGAVEPGHVGGPNA